MSENCLKSLFVVYEAKKREVTVVLLSIDAEKAFDRVNWSFMLETLKHLDIGNRMIQWISAFHYHPTANILINRELFPSLELFNGTRQGCPLSPMLFAITLEPLLAVIHKNTDIRGVRIGDNEYNVATYADNVFFYILTLG